MSYKIDISIKRGGILCSYQIAERFFDFRNLKKVKCLNFSAQKQIRTQGAKKKFYFFKQYIPAFRFFIRFERFLINRKSSFPSGFNLFFHCFLGGLGRGLELGSLPPPYYKGICYQIYGSVHCQVESIFS